jgi:uncharacterized protein (TIRG00374 family)
MDTSQDKAIKTFSPRKVSIAIAIGLSITSYLLYQNIHERGLNSLINVLSNPNWLWLLGAILILLLRDVSYIYRIKNLTHGELSVKGSAYTILLWEFASAVTPSVVGGTTVAVFILAKEGIKFGKALAYVMLTAVLDNAFFLLAAPIALLTTNSDIFTIIGKRTIFGFHLPVEQIFYVSYSLIAIYTFVMAYSLLINPRSFKWLLLKITKYRLLRKWRAAANTQSSEMVLASAQLKGASKTYWIKAIISTIVIWSARYLMLNFLITAFTDGIGFAAQIDIFSKQIILWVVQLVSPTPGAAGIAEKFFDLFFKGSNYGSDDLWVPLAFLWRIFTYYAYLIAGVIIFPRWLKRVSEKA